MIMKSSIYNLFVVTLLVCLSVKYASSIQCYVCDQKYDTQTNQHLCESGIVSDTMTQHCPGSLCGLIMLPGHHISRTCESSMPSEIVASRGISHGLYNGQEWSTCSTALCNGGEIDTIHCYKCDSRYDEACINAVNENMKQKCRADVYECSITNKTTKSGEVIINRGCGYENKKENVNNGKFTTPGGDSISWNTCHTNMCNGKLPVCVLFNTKKNSNRSFIPTSTRSMTAIGTEFIDGREDKMIDCIVEKLCKTEKKRCFYSSVDKNTMSSMMTISLMRSNPIYRIEIEIDASWGVMNKYQMKTLILSAVLSLASLYYFS